MPRFSSWRHRVSQILAALRTLDCEELQRTQIESLFGLQRRAALRLMAPLVSASRNGSWQVDRQRLVQWLEGFEQEVTEEQQRHQLVLQALHDVEAENRSLLDIEARGLRTEHPLVTRRDRNMTIFFLPTGCCRSIEMTGVSAR
jgi:hypothetical protein